jgi:DNA-binding response OmpR family regulator
MKQGKYTVLVVEDETFILECIAQYLRDDGFQVVQATNATDAVGVILSRQDIDLVFTDVRMPGGMDGVLFAQWVRKNYPGIPVLIASGHVAREDITNELCEVEVFVKPYEPHAVVNKVRALLIDREVPLDDPGSASHQYH